MLTAAALVETRVVLNRLNPATCDHCFARLATASKVLGNKVISKLIVELLLRRADTDELYHSSHEPISKLLQLHMNHVVRFPDFRTVLYKAFQGWMPSSEFLSKLMMLSGLTAGTKLMILTALYDMASVWPNEALAQLSSHAFVLLNQMRRVVTKAEMEQIREDPMFRAVLGSFEEFQGSGLDRDPIRMLSEEDDSIPVPTAVELSHCLSLEAIINWNPANAIGGTEILHRLRPLTVWDKVSLARLWTYDDEEHDRQLEKVTQLFPDSTSRFSFDFLDYLVKDGPRSEPLTFTRFVKNLCILFKLESQTLVRGLLLARFKNRGVVRQIYQAIRNDNREQLLRFFVENLPTNPMMSELVQKFSKGQASAQMMRHMEQLDRSNIDGLMRFPHFVAFLVNLTDLFPGDPFKWAQLLSRSLTDNQEQMTLSLFSTHQYAVDQLYGMSIFPQTVTAVMDNFKTLKEQQSSHQALETIRRHLDVNRRGWHRATTGLVSVLFRTRFPELVRGSSGDIGGKSARHPSSSPFLQMLAKQFPVLFLRAIMDMHLLKPRGVEQIDPLVGFLNDVHLLDKACYYLPIRPLLRKPNFGLAIDVMVHGTHRSYLNLKFILSRVATGLRQRRQLIVDLYKGDPRFPFRGLETKVLMLERQWYSLLLNHVCNFYPTDLVVLTEVHEFVEATLPNSPLRFVYSLYSAHRHLQGLLQKLSAGPFVPGGDVPEESFRQWALTNINNVVTNDIILADLARCIVQQVAQMATGANVFARLISDQLSSFNHPHTTPDAIRVTEKRSRIVGLLFGRVSLEVDHQISQVGQYFGRCIQHSISTQNSLWLYQLKIFFLYAMEALRPSISNLILPIRQYFLSQLPPEVLDPFLSYINAILELPHVPVLAYIDPFAEELLVHHVYQKPQTYPSVIPGTIGILALKHDPIFKRLHPEHLSGPLPGGVTLATGAPAHPAITVDQQPERRGGESGESFSAELPPSQLSAEGEAPRPLPQHISRMLLQVPSRIRPVIEELIPASTKITEGLTAYVVQVLNQVGDENLDQKAEEVSQQLRNPDDMIFFCLYVSIVRVGSEERSVRYRDLLIKADGGKHIATARKLLCLFVDRLFHDSQGVISSLSRSGLERCKSERNFLERIGQFLGSLTIARDSPIHILELDMKDLLYRAYTKDWIVWAFHFVFNVLVPLKEAPQSIFTPPNPFTVQMLYILWEISQKDRLSRKQKLMFIYLMRNLQVESPREIRYMHHWQARIARTAMEAAYKDVETNINSLLLPVITSVLSQEFALCGLSPATSDRVADYVAFVFGSYEDQVMSMLESGYHARYSELCCGEQQSQVDDIKFKRNLRVARDKLERALISHCHKSISRLISDRQSAFEDRSVSDPMFSYDPMGLNRNQQVVFDMYAMRLPIEDGTIETAYEMMLEVLAAWNYEDESDIRERMRRLTMQLRLYRNRDEIIEGAVTRLLNEKMLEQPMPQHSCIQLMLAISNVFPRLPAIIAKLLATPSVITLANSEVISSLLANKLVRMSSFFSYIQSLLLSDSGETVTRRGDILVNVARFMTHILVRLNFLSLDYPSVLPVITTLAQIYKAIDVSASQSADDVPPSGDVLGLSLVLPSTPVPPESKMDSHAATSGSPVTPGVPPTPRSPEEDVVNALLKAASPDTLLPPELLQAYKPHRHVLLKCLVECHEKFIASSFTRVVRDVAGFLKQFSLYVLSTTTEGTSEGIDTSEIIPTSPTELEQPIRILTLKDFPHYFDHFLSIASLSMQNVSLFLRRLLAQAVLFAQKNQEPGHYNVIPVDAFCQYLFCLLEGFDDKGFIHAFEHVLLVLVHATGDYRNSAVRGIMDFPANILHRIFFRLLHFVYLQEKWDSEELYLLFLRIIAQLSPIQVPQFAISYLILVSHRFIVSHGQIPARHWNKFEVAFLPVLSFLDVLWEQEADSFRQYYDLVHRTLLSLRKVVPISFPTRFIQFRTMFGVPPTRDKDSTFFPIQIWLRKDNPIDLEHILLSRDDLNIVEYVNALQQYPELPLTRLDDISNEILLRIFSEGVHQAGLLMIAQNLLDQDRFPTDLVDKIEDRLEILSTRETDM